MRITPSWLLQIATACAISLALVAAGCEPELGGTGSTKQSASGGDKPRVTERSAPAMRADAADAAATETPQDAGLPVPDGPSKMDNPPAMPAVPSKPSRTPDASMPPAAAGASGSSGTEPPRDDQAAELDAGSAPNEPPEKLWARIKQVSAEGTLCPAGSYHASVSSDLAALTLTFSAAELSPGPAESLDGSCRIHMQLDVPDGYQFSSIRVAPSGYLYAQDGSVSFGLSYAFTGDRARQSFEHPDLTGDRDFVFAEVADEVWSPSCRSAAPNELLELVVELRLAAQADTYINLSAFDLDFTQADARWRACGATN